MTEKRQESRRAVQLGQRFQEALLYANVVHGGQLRKGTHIPYISHVLAVAAIVLEYAGNEDEAIAALLHDAVEDAGGPARLADIRARFGDAVAAIVEGCSDTDEQPKPEWRPRKQKYIDHLKDASPSTRLVSAADKLANVRSIVKDYAVHGPDLWGRFNGGRETVWYYRALTAVFRTLGPETIARALEAELARIDDPA
jgi:GTP pyrophosphokinase